MIDLDNFIQPLRRKPTEIISYSTAVTIMVVGINTKIEVWHPSNKLVITLPNNGDVNKYTLTYDPGMNWIVYDEIKHSKHGDDAIYNKHHKVHFKQIFKRNYDYLPELELKELITLYEIIILDLEMAKYGNKHQI